MENTVKRPANKPAVQQQQQPDNSLIQRIVAAMQGMFGPEAYQPGKHHDTNRMQQSESYLRKLRKHRKARRHMARASRRINRMRAA